MYLGGVDIVVVGDEVVRGSEGVEQLEGAVEGARVVKGLSGVVPVSVERVRGRVNMYM